MRTKIKNFVGIVRILKGGGLLKIRPSPWPFSNPHIKKSLWPCRMPSGRAFVIHSAVASYTRHTDVLTNVASKYIRRKSSERRAITWRG